MFERIGTYFFSSFIFRERAFLFKKGIYLVAVVQSLYWLFHYDVYFGAESVIPCFPKRIPYPGNAVFFIYDHPRQEFALYIILLTGVLSTAALLFSYRLQLLGDIFIWLMMLNLHNAIYPTLTGGDLLLNQLLFFNAFLATREPSISGWKKDLRTFFHNIGCIGIIIQVCLAYFLSAYAKLEDKAWTDGKAIEMILSIKHFSLVDTSECRSSAHFLAILVNYVVLFYQLSFPILIWIKPLKKPFLILGVLMHLYIALFMGLVKFGLVMVLPYIFLWPGKKAHP
jgi:hypothetical protein